MKSKGISDGLTLKQESIRRFQDHVSSGKTIFFQKYKMDIVMDLVLKDDVSGPVMSKAAYDNGLLMVYANNDTSICQFLPPLVMSFEQVDEVMEKLDKALMHAAELRDFF